MLVEKKAKTSSAAHEGSPAVDKLVINLTSSKGKKDKAAKYELVTFAIPKVASMIADMIAQRRGSVVPLVSKFMLKRLLRAKSGSPLERLAIMKSDKVDPAVRMALKPTPLTAKTDSPVEKEETACVGSCEKSTKPVSREAAEIYALLKPNLLEDIDACAKLVNGVKRVVCPSSFAKHMTKYMRTALLAMM
ncbi:hypothetical protein FF2_014138 [Malus domestica]